MKEVWYWMTSSQASNLGHLLRGTGLIFIAIASWWAICMFERHRNK